VDAPSTTIAGLANYSVSVSVNSTVNLNGISGGEAKKITVTVTGPINTTVTLEGYRTNYTGP
jgi:MSHA pilin protein MshD